MHGVNDYPHSAKLYPDKNERSAHPPYYMKAWYMTSCYDLEEDDRTAHPYQTSINLHQSLTPLAKVHSHPLDIRCHAMLSSGSVLVSGRNAVGLTSCLMPGKPCAPGLRLLMCGYELWINGHAPAMADS